MPEKVYTQKDLVSFGLYMVSDERKELFENNTNFSSDAINEKLKRVYDSDLSNWENSDASLI
jgi:hypothetical protein